MKAEGRTHCMTRKLYNETMAQLLYCDNCTEKNKETGLPCTCTSYSSYEEMKADLDRY